MKTILFFFALLAGITASAANATITITPLSVDYSSQKVKFRVAWTGTPANNSNRVWVFVDFCSAPGVSPSTFAPATITSASVTSGTYTDFNGRSFYVNANGTTVTTKLDNANGKFNWCAYGTDFPPNAKDNDSGGYNLKGSPPFILSTSNGPATVTTNIYSGGTITALTDATGCPGVLCGNDGKSAGLLNCCVTGTTSCSGTCKTNQTYTANDGVCTNTCYYRWQQLYDQCGVKNSQYAQISDITCKNGCSPTCTTCHAMCQTTKWKNASYHVDTGEAYCVCHQSQLCTVGEKVQVYKWVSGGWDYAYDSKWAHCNGVTACQ
jgi:hypothetical protein